MASGCGQSFFDSDELSSNVEEDITPEIVAETTPGQIDYTVCISTAGRLYLNSPPELINSWGQVKLNQNDFHSDLTEISSTFRIPDITHRCRQHEEMHSY